MSRSPVEFVANDFESRSVRWEDVEAFLVRRWKMILVVLLATTLGTYTALQLMTERYESSASLMVKVGRENAEIPSTVQKTGLVTGGVNEQIVNSEIQMLTSHSLAEDVVDRIGLQAFQTPLAPPASVLELPKYCAKTAFRWVKKQGNEVLFALALKRRLSDREAAVTTIVDALQVQAEKNSQVISVHLELPSPELGKRVVQELVDLYLVRHAKVYQDSGVDGFFTAQLKEKDNELKQLLSRRESMRNRYSVSSVSEQRSLLLKQLSDIKTQLQMNESEEAMLIKQTDLMTERLPQVPREFQSSQIQTQNPSIPSIRDRLTSLQLEHAKLASRYVAGAEPLSKNEEEIAELNALLTAEQPTLLGNVTSQVNPVSLSFTEGIEQDSIKIQGLRAKNAALRQPLGDIENRLKDLNLGEDQLHGIQREIELTEQSYNAYAKDLEEARISQQMDLRRIANVSVLTTPSSTYAPVYPRKLLVMELAFPLGLFLGLVLALCVEYMDDTVRSSEDLDDVDGLPCLGSFRISLDSKDYERTPARG